MTRRFASAAFVTALLFGTASGLAHHPIAPQYDAEREITLEGTVASFEWRSPHSSLELRTGSEREAKTWTIELDGSSVLEELGWSRDSLEPGQRVTVMAWPARGDTARALARSVRIDGGEELAAINPHAPEYAEYAQRQETAPGRGERAGERAEVSLVGCVELESDYRQRTDAGRGGFLGSGLGVGNEFVLVDARPAREELSQQGTAVGTTGDTRDDHQAHAGASADREPGAVGTSGEPSVFNLTGDAERELARAVGRQVHIVGELEHEGSDQGASARVRDLPRINITAWHPVNDFCPAR